LQELKTLFENHRKQNDEWIERMRQEIDAEYRATAEEKMTLQLMRSCRNKKPFNRRGSHYDTTTRIECLVYEYNIVC